MKEIQVQRLNENAKLPTQGSMNSAGYDLYYAGDDDILKPGECKMFGLGIAVAFEPGNVALIWDRSGMGSKGIHRFAGVIDADYRGEWRVVLWNSTEKGKLIQRGDKIAQVLFQKVETQLSFEWIDSLEKTERGKGGFGSTGA